MTDVLWAYFTAPLTAARVIEQFVVSVTVAGFTYLFARLALRAVKR